MNRRRLISLVGSSAVLAGCIDRAGDASGGEGEGESNGDGSDTGDRTNSTGDESDSDSGDGVETDDATGRNGTESGSTGDGDGTNGSESDGRDDSGDDGVSDVERRDPPECDGSLRSPSGMFDEVEHDRIETTGGGTFELVADPETVALGEELFVTLRCVGDDGDEAMTGNDEKFTVERETDDGWTSIYRLPEHYGLNDIGITKPELSPPATWFEWSFELTREGVEHSTELDTPYAVCDPLEPGTYRFVYWGVTTPAERESDWETEYAIGVEFQVTD